MKIKLTLALLTTAALTGCHTESYYLSPFSTISNPYHAQPLVSDSVKSASYFGGSLYGGLANYDARDPTVSIQASIHRSHTFKHFQAYYGGALTAGLYHVSDYDSSGSGNTNYYNYVNVPAINKGSGDNHFEGAMFNAGMNAVLPFGRGSEWRIIGTEVALGKEWGRYAKFRKELPDSAASAIYRNDRFGNICLTTEMVFRRRSGNSLGFKIAVGRSFYRTYELYEDYNYYNNKNPYINPIFFSAAFQYTRKKTTMYVKLNAASYAGGLQFGANYKLSKK